MNLAHISSSHALCFFHESMDLTPSCCLPARTFGYRYVPPIKKGPSRPHALRSEAGSVFYFIFKAESGHGADSSRPSGGYGQAAGGPP